MCELPSKGWGPWRREFYSLHSNVADQAADTNHVFGFWCNAWISRAGRIIFRFWPNLWRWWVNLPPFRAKTTRKLQKFFPNLR